MDGDIINQSEIIVNAKDYPEDGQGITEKEISNDLIIMERSAIRKKVKIETTGNKVFRRLYNIHIVLFCVREGNALLCLFSGLNSLKM